MQLWHEVEKRLARLQTERLHALVDQANPSGGLSEVRVDGCALADFHPLGVELPATRSDDEPDGIERYARSGDLVVTYADRPAGAMRAQLYWRAGVHPLAGAIAAIELVASVQTSMLDSCPTLSVRTQLIAAEAYRLTAAQGGSFAAIVPPGASRFDDAPGLPQCYLFRLPGRRFSYAEMVHPADARQSEWEGWLHGADYRLQLRHELFAERLEKGVILRARVLGVILDRQDDKRAALDHWNAFLHEALPLTT